ncbi:glycoside hydrolase family 3 C-terminal domain-containing protein [Arthrobacter sp. zg-Y20]|uniref:beta-glucosidase n=1 Tax=unclassified Arthrobacter TaxID=235627 RepID=UPI001D14E1D9|nr:MULTISPECIES: glycoside hydrolase family 3 C-terminal domain-containing protein [unclassified Arthrobacter]MCC3276552.1 glycoside hydrolase family 3 C-terminal domain-containing protein [Arthrobacter sp. zg-Y20]MDK1316712.1 glycoside hydrolase family 3 C-terminal domain-containing protein [Arthrobacter sp. zg.Y20]WIB06865.1 glycoside hydrolase family 3 C-terminal domain-containing protein [Arthrobacter sp. zg-Y20]
MEPKRSINQSPRRRATRSRPTPHIFRKAIPKRSIRKRTTALLAGLLMAGSFLPVAAVAAEPAQTGVDILQAAPPDISQFPWGDPSLSPDLRATLVVAAMSLEQKVELLVQSGGTGVPEFGIPPIRSKDGCCGLALETEPSTSLPVGLSLASALDPTLGRAYGAVAGEEARATGYNTIAGPTMNLGKTPYNGRLWEAFGEDPLVSGDSAVAQVQGEQGASVSALPKQYMLNNFETRRGNVDVLVDQRTLQETYVRPWAQMVEESDPGSIMCSFNKVNGEYACGNDQLLNQILKTQTGFAGFVTSDFNAAHSFADYAAGLDVSGPGLEFSGPNLLAAVQNGTVSEARVTDAARRVARTMFAKGIVDNPPIDTFVNPQPTDIPIPANMLDAHDAIAQSVAEAGTVLLKNDGALPLAAGTPSIGVIGSDADWYIDGGGSGAVPTPARLTTILDGITARAGDASVEYARGTDPVGLGDTIPGPPPLPSGVLTDVNAEYRLGLNNFEGTPTLARTEQQVNLRTGISADEINTSQVPGVGGELAASPMTAVWTGTIVAPATGNYTFSLTHLGTARLFLDGAEVINEPADNLATQEIGVNMAEGQRIPIRIEYITDAPNQFNGGLNDQPGAMIRLGWTPPGGVLQPSIQEAVDVASRNSVAVIVARDYTGEAADRGSLTLPQNQDALISAVTAANPNTVVVLATSGPVTMPWIDAVPSVLEAWYPGQAQGRAVASVLFGDVNPSGKLPVTFPVSDQQASAVTPPYPFNFLTTVSPVVPYAEGVFVGYKAYTTQGAVPLFPFGHGLSYTRFDYANLFATPEVDADDPDAEVAVQVTNIGTYPGEETVQVYVGNLPTGVPTPARQLAGYGSISLPAGGIGTVNIDLDPQSLQYWDVNAGGWVTPTGQVPIYVGRSVDDIRLAGFITVV